MGRTIRKTAAMDDILSTADMTIANAHARGGKWAELADQTLGATMGLVKEVRVERTQTQAALVTLDATLDAARTDAGRLVGSTSDEIWNALGRPGNDVGYSILFADGIDTYLDDEVEAIPARMETLATLIDKRVHPRITAEDATRHAAAIRAKARTLQEAIDAARLPRSRANVLESVYAVLMRTTATDLSKLKKRYLAEGYTEADIHTVIPSRPAPTKKAEVPAPAPVPAPKPAA